MSALTTMTRTQTKVLLREPMAVFFGLIFPGLLLLMIGLVFPGATDPSPDLGGLRLVDIYAPVTLVLGLATVALSMLPPVLGTDRERGVLRRLSTTPVHPRVLVTAHLSVQLVVAACAGAAAIAVGVLMFDIPLPRSPGWFLATFLLAASSLMALGLLVGSVVRTSAAGQSVGMMIYFPLLFFAGVWFPLEVMPEGIRTISGLVPTGAAVPALGAAWSGSSPEFSSLLVMALYTLVAGFLATRLFRWE